jgi:ferredoxin
MRHVRSDPETRGEPVVAVLKADFALCQGYANCVDAAPDVYDVDDDGVVVLLRDHVPDQGRPRIEEAVRSCPMSALSIEDE